MAKQLGTKINEYEYKHMFDCYIPDFDDYVQCGLATAEDAESARIKRNKVFAAMAEDGDFAEYMFETIEAADDPKWWADLISIAHIKF